MYQGWWLALGGEPGASQFATGVAVQPTASVTVGFQPDGVLIAGIATDPADPSYSGDMEIALGASDGVKERSSFTGGREGEESWGYCGDAIYDAGEANTNTILAEAQLTAMTGTGFTLDWSTDDGKLRPFGWVAFQTDNFDAATPTVTTDAATGILYNSATLNGTINPGSAIGQEVDFFFDYATVPGGPYARVAATPSSGDGGSPIAISYLLATSASTNYYFRAVAVVRDTGCEYDGDELSFTTPEITATHIHIRVGRTPVQVPPS
jgi:hypothetical protein